MVPQPPRCRPGVLSDLQRQVAELIAGLPEAQGFALAGGAALIARGDVVRREHSGENDHLFRLSPTT